MPDFSNLFDMQGMLFSLMTLGAFLEYKGIVSKSGQKTLTDLVLNVTLPCAIVRSFQLDFDRRILAGGLTVLVVAVAIQVGCLILAHLLYPHLREKRKKVAQYGTICSNGGILGNPIAEGIFGPMGLLYASVYLIPQRIFMWSFGLAYFTEAGDKKAVFKKVAANPCIVAVAIGLLLMTFPIPLPEFFNQALRSVANANTALSTILVGTFLTGFRLDVLRDRDTLYYTFIRLILIPGLVLSACRFAGLDDLVTGVSVVLAGMPIASVTSVLAAQYHGDEVFATGCLILSTSLSMITVPLWCLLLV